MGTAPKGVMGGSLEITAIVGGGNVMPEDKTKLIVQGCSLTLHPGQSALVI